MSTPQATSRPSGRGPAELRKVTFETSFTRHAEGSVLASFGDTRVLCTASVEAGVPSFMRNSGRGWITAEYGMLPRATHTRSRRESAQGKQSGRTLEIQRLIGRSCGRRRIFRLWVSAPLPLTAMYCRPMGAPGPRQFPAVMWRWCWRCSPC